MTTTTSATSSSTASTATTGTSSSSTSSATSTGQQILTALGAGSGVDTDTIITGLTAAQKTTLEGAITTKQTANAAQISTLASIASDMNTFSTSLNTLVAGGTLMTQPTSSDTSVVTVSAIAGSRLGNLSSSIEVDQLAQAQTIESKVFTSSDTIPTGTLTLTTASQPNGVSITIDNTNNSVAGIAAAINAANAGVTASVLTDSNGSRLVLKGQTGAAQTFSLSGSAGLEPFNYTPPASSDTSTSTASDTGMGRDQVAQDAIIKVDGATVTRATNSFSDVISGVQISLVSAKPGTTISLGANRPTAAITQSVNDFVTAYNSLKAELTAATASATNGGTAGPLNGNSTLRDMQRQLAALTTTPLTASGTITTLAQLGVKTAQDGTLSVDGTMLASVLASNPDDVEAMFNPTQSSSSANVSIASKIGAVATGTYTLTNLSLTNGTASGSINGVPAKAIGPVLYAATGSGADGLMVSLFNTPPGTATLTIDQGLAGALQAITNSLTGTSGTITALQSSLQTQSTTLAQELTAADAKLQVYHDRLVTQFSTMNTRVSGFKATQSYLTQQVALWTKSS